MEKTQEKPVDECKRSSNWLPVPIKCLSQTWPQNLTEIDLSNQEIDNFKENLILPPNLNNLNLAHNNLEAIPVAVVNHSNIKHLDVSFNKIVFFDDTPGFCQVIECLNLANNNLQGPPYWVWSETPTNLVHLNLSKNLKLADSLDETYFDELLSCRSVVKHVVLNDCRLGKFEKIFGIFVEAKHIEIGTQQFSCFSANLLNDTPGPGLSRCCDIERLNLQNTKIFNVNANIALFKYLVEINLADNHLRGLPEEFGSLEKLETCVLSNNFIMYLPGSISGLQQLQCLRVDQNELCLLTEDLTNLPKLKTLDVYNNGLYEVPENFWNISEIDAAQNYFEQPDGIDYIEKKAQLRTFLKATDRMDGNKVETKRPESEHSPDITDDETFMKQVQEHNDGQSQGNPASSSEDWDSDRYWVPHTFRAVRQPPHASWMQFIKKRLNEGVFCPIDLHTVSIFEKVMYEKQCNPKEQHESEGQFDDLTEDDS